MVPPLFYWLCPALSPSLRDFHITLLTAAYIIYIAVRTVGWGMGGWLGGGCRQRMRRQLANTRMTLQEQKQSPKCLSAGQQGGVDVDI